MPSVFSVVLPIFALLLAGWTTRRLGVLGPHATTELNRFVVHLALPALLFDIVAHADWRDLWRPDVIVAFGLGSGAVFAFTVVWRLRSRPLADAAVDGLNAAYSNCGFMGFPLAQALFGPAGLPPTLIAVILTVCVVFAIALVLIEVGVQEERRPGRVLATVARSLTRNPLLVSPLLGAFVLAWGGGVPAPLERFVSLLGAAASPCALVTLGLFLTESRDAGRVAPREIATLVALKLVGQPLLSWMVADRWLGMPAPSVHLVVLLAALPTGTGPFMVAEFYRREAGLTAKVILVSTLASLATITLYLTWVRAHSGLGS